MARELPYFVGMKRKCPKCLADPKNCSKFGFFVRASDGRRLQRYVCKNCRTTFSDAATQECYRQRKRKLNPRICELLNSKVSQRRIARLLKISRRTVAKRFLFLAKIAHRDNQVDFEKLATVYEIQFDDLETFEHTKCKPLSVTLAVEEGSRYILGFKVSRMPAKGHLAKLSRKKYGHRPDERGKARQDLFSEITSKVAKNALIKSDKNPHYTADVKKWFPHAEHWTTLGGRGCITGQGELKKASFDPIFSINHTFAMLRANINRLVRQTWCTTKTPERLVDHIAIYVRYHNRVLIQT